MPPKAAKIGNAKRWQEIPPRVMKCRRRRRRNETLRVSYPFFPPEVEGKDSRLRRRRNETLTRFRDFCPYAGRAPGRDTSSGRRCPSPEVPPWPESVNHSSSVEPEKLVHCTPDADCAASAETCEELSGGQFFGLFGAAAPHKQRSKRGFTRRAYVRRIGM